MSDEERGGFFFARRRGARSATGRNRTGVRAYVREAFVVKSHRVHVTSTLLRTHQPRLFSTAALALALAFRAATAGRFPVRAAADFPPPPARTAAASRRAQFRRDAAASPRAGGACPPSNAVFCLFPPGLDLAPSQPPASRHPRPVQPQPPRAPLGRFFRRSSSRTARFAAAAAAADARFLDARETRTSRSPILAPSSSSPTRASPVSGKLHVEGCPSPGWSRGRARPAQPPQPQRAPGTPCSCGKTR